MFRSNVSIHLILNTISVEEQPAMPGDQDMERRIRALIRWNALAMVLRANKTGDDLGGHLASFCIFRHFVRCGFNHFSCCLGQFRR